MEKKTNHFDDDNFSEDVIQQLRENGIDEAESPHVQRDFSGPKEISIKRSAWVVRGLIIFMLMLFFGEVYLLSKVQLEDPQMIAHFQGGPSREVIAAPVVKAPQSAPAIAGADELAAEEAENLIPPTPTPAPLPAELSDIEIPPPDA